MSEIKVDTVAEKTSANGVTVDGLNIKDSKLVTANSVITSNITDLNITSGKIANDAVTLAKMASGTDGNIISYDASGNPVAIATGNDGQVLTSTGAGSQPAFETLPVSGIANADQWYLTTTFQATGGTTIASNWARSNYGTTLPLGTGMSQSSGIFSFPSTGYWFIVGQTTMNKQNQSYYCGINLETTDNNSSYVRAVESNDETTSQAGSHANANFSFIKKVTSTSNSKVRLVTSAQATTNFAGNGNYLVTGLTFIRLGDV